LDTAFTIAVEGGGGDDELNGDRDGAGACACDFGGTGACSDACSGFCTGFCTGFGGTGDCVGFGGTLVLDTGRE